MIEIEVCERLMDRRYVPVIKDGRVVDTEVRPKFHACIKGEHGYWGSGDSVQDAIGSVINAHPERFGLKITFLEGPLAR